MKRCQKKLPGHTPLLNHSDSTSKTRSQPLECSYFYSPRITGLQPTLMRPAVYKGRALEIDRSGKGKEDTDIEKRCCSKRGCRCCRAVLASTCDTRGGERYHCVALRGRLRQDNPTNPLRSKGMPSRPESAPANGWFEEVTVLQHDIEPTSHWLALIEPVLATGIAAAETPVATAKAAMKETRGLESIIVKVGWRLWQSWSCALD